MSVITHHEGDGKPIPYRIHHTLAWEADYAAFIADGYSQRESVELANLKARAGRA